MSRHAIAPSEREVSEDEIADYVMTVRELEDWEGAFEQVGGDWRAHQDEFIRLLIRWKRKGAQKVTGDPAEIQKTADPR